LRGVILVSLIYPH